MPMDQLLTPVDDIASRVEFESLIADLSSRFVNMPPEEVDRGIEDALDRACTVLGVDFAALWQWSLTDPEQISPTHVVYLQKDLRPPEEMREVQFPWCRRELRAGRMIAIGTLADLPEEADVDRETCRALGVKSNLSLPLSVGGATPMGVLSFSTLHAERA